MRTTQGYKIFGLFVLALLLSIPTVSAPLSSARAQQPVDLLLVLAIDCSYSVSAQEFALQRDGLALAMQTPEVIEAIESGPSGAIGVAVMQWSSLKSQVLVIPWQRIDSRAGAYAFADRLAGMQRQALDGATSLSSAMLQARRLLAAAPYPSLRAVVDISGDGRNNNGPELEPARRTLEASGITVNGLAILNEDPTLDYYFRDRLIAGFGAFVEIANDYAEYRDAIRRKLVKEVRFVPVSEGAPRFVQEAHLPPFTRR